MKIKLKTRLAGPEGNFPSGTELNLDTKEANSLIAGGYAVSLEPEIYVDKVKPKANASSKANNKSKTNAKPKTKAVK